MAGTINSLGLGSGVLTSDLLDKLKTADTAALVTPIDKKITLNAQKMQAVDLLTSLLSSYKSSVSALNDDALYQKRNVSGNTDAIKVTANSGVAVQSFSISDTQLALKNIKESGKFSSTSNSIATGSGTVTMTVGSASYNINYTNTMSLDQFKDSINSTAGASVKASTLQVGANDYRLILTSVETGADQVISLTDSVDGTLGEQLRPYNPVEVLPTVDDGITNLNGMQEIQAARDASFKYNGITLTRSKNEVTDITAGVTISLLQNSGSTNISITQDAQAISDEMSSMVASYNTLTSQLNDMTTTNPTSGAVGIFNGESSINSISREINRIITSSNSSGLSLPNFGINLDETGVMSFNSSTFLAKFNANPETAEAFLSGSTTVDSSGNTKTADGVFSTLQSLLEGYTKTNGKVKTMTTAYTDESKVLLASKIRSQALLEARYETMSSRFAQYDSIISKLNSQFNSLKQQIDAQALAASGG
jgi:flagellar hook-associated protein 2